MEYRYSCMNKHGSSSPGPVVATTVAVAMAVFSGYMFLRTGDWVALVFLIGSLGYAVFFAFYRR